MATPKQHFSLARMLCSCVLVNRFRVLHARALLILASGYVFFAVMAAANGLTYPNLFSPTGLLGAGPQSTASIYLMRRLI